MSTSPDPPYRIWCTRFGIVWFPYTSPLPRDEALLLATTYALESNSTYKALPVGVDPNEPSP